MIKFEKKILENFEHSQKNYETNLKSYHWDYQIKKKKNLYKIENLNNFRKNFIIFYCKFTSVRPINPII